MLWIAKFIGADDPVSGHLKNSLIAKLAKKVSFQGWYRNRC